MENLTRVAMDKNLQINFEKDFNNCDFDYFLLKERVKDHSKNIETNRADLINNIQDVIFRLKEVEKYLKNIELQDYSNEIDIPFTFNCVECGTKLNNGDDFNYCKHCLDDYKKEQSFTN